MRISQPLFATIALLGIAASAAADPQTPSRLNWVTNGEVRAAVQVGNTLYVGGTFTRVAPRSGVLGSLFGMSATAGDLTGPLPFVDGTVNAVEPDGAGGYYIGGVFTTVGGVARARLAHLLPDGSVDPVFAPTLPNGEVRAIRRGAALLFVGGDLGDVNGAPRGNLVALNPITGASVPRPLFTGAPVKTLLLQGATVIAVSQSESASAAAFNQVTGDSVWTTSVPGSVNAAVVVGSRLILGGYFRILATGLRLISLDVTTGVRDAAWVPDSRFDPGLPLLRVFPVMGLAVSGDTLYVGGSFSEFGAQARAHVAAVTISTAAVTEWAPATDGDVSALAVSPGGSVFIAGAFIHVNGQPRGDFAEVDAAGTLTDWVTDIGSQGKHSFSLSGDLLVVGTQYGVRGGGARMNLAAFDLSTDALLPWAPAASDFVTRLGGVGDSIFIGASRVADLPVRTINLVSAVHAVSGAPLPWAPPGTPLFGHLLLGTVGSYVYISADFDSANLPNLGNGIRRLDPVTGAVDPSWLVAGANPSRMTVSENTLYFAAASTIWVADATTGGSSQWNPMPPVQSITGLAVDGRTLYVGTVASIAAFDRVSRLPVVGIASSTPPLQLLGSTVRSLAVADGQVLLAGSAVLGSSPGGQTALWNPALSRSAEAPADALLVTPTDVIVLGYDGDTPVPVHGIAVFPRTASVAPTSLRGTSIDNQVTLTWDGASVPPSGGYLIDVAAESGSPAPVSLPALSGTSVTGVAGNGTYFVRVRSAGAPAGPASTSTNEIALVVGCSAPPSVPPSSVAAQVSGSNVTITWMAPPFTSVSSYILEAGSSAGASNIGRFTLPGSQTAIGSAVPNGTYFARIRTANACGESEPSTEIFFTVGSGTTILPAPTGLRAESNIGGATVQVDWNASPGALGYLLEVGSAPGQSDLATLQLSTATFEVCGSVPNGLYYLRVRAGNGAGLSPPSTEVVLRVFAP